MRFLTRLIPIVLLSFAVICVSTPANAQFEKFQDLKFPKVEVPEWKTGQSVSYALKLGGIEDLKDVSIKLRIALVGLEMIESQEYAWLEYDLSDLKGLPPEAMLPFKALKMKILLRPNENYMTDPKLVMTDFASGKMIKKIIFQMDDQTPQMIDFMTVQGMLQGMTGQDLESLLKELPTEEAEKADNVAIESKAGKENVTVPAGTFNDAAFMWFKGTDKKTGDSGEGKYHAHQKVPLFGMVKMAMNIKAEKENVNVVFELVDYAMSGAQSWIKGEPVPFDFMQFMGGMSEMPGMMEGAPMGK